MTGTSKEKSKKKRLKENKKESITKKEWEDRKE